jgi:uncharacterized protein YdaU (DUF1376 family)
MSAQWMPLYVGDYLRDTRRLTTLEHGAYMLLIMEYWTNGGLPDDDRRLARIAGLSADEWSQIRPTIADLFHDGWKHKRIDKELARATGKSDAARAAAELRWQREREAEAMRTHSVGNANAMLPEPQPEPENKNTEIQETSIGGLVAFPAAHRKATRAKPKTQISETHQPTEKSIAFAGSEGMDKATMRVEWPQFRDHHLKVGSRFSDWDAAWRTWVREWRKRGGTHKARAGPSLPPEKRNPVFQAFEQIMAERYGTEDDSEQSSDVFDGTTIELVADPGGSESHPGGPNGFARDDAASFGERVRHEGDAIGLRGTTGRFASG